MRKTLLDELIKFTKKDKVRAHMPGHNGGKGLSRKFRHHAFSVDVTEFDETDNLQNPSGIILKSEKRAAGIFGAERTFFMVNGSTSGLEAAILTLAGKGDKIIVDRTCHKAVISAIILAGAEPVFIEPRFDKRHGIYAELSAAAVMDALRANPGAAAVVITSPSYYGVCSDVKGIAEKVHSAGLPLIVDEAHGAHFAFSDRLPETALSCGADIVVQSAHKTLPSPGQTALLHVGAGGRIDIDRLRRNINLIQTSSPSYMLLSGIDDAVRRMNRPLRKQLSAVIERVIEIKSRISVIDKVSCLVKSELESDYDLTKLVIDFSKLGITGYGAAELLKKDYGIYTEMADEKNVLFYITASTNKRDLSLIERAVNNISAGSFKPQEILKPRPLPRIRLTADMREAYFGQSETVSIDAAAGRTAAEILVCCPPCCPIVVPGQLIDEETVRYIKSFTNIEEVSVQV